MTAQPITSYHDLASRFPAVKGVHTIPPDAMVTGEIYLPDGHRVAVRGDGGAVELLDYQLAWLRDSTVRNLCMTVRDALRFIDGCARNFVSIEAAGGVLQRWQFDDSLERMRDLSGLVQALAKANTMPKPRRPKRGRTRRSRQARSKRRRSQTRLAMRSVDGES